MQPRGARHAGTIRRLELFVIGLLALAIPAMAPALANDGGGASSSDPISSLIGAAGKALGLGPSKPSYARTRFVIELAKPVAFEVFALTRPNRVVIEVPNVPVGLPVAPSGSGRAQLIEKIRSGQAGADKTRIIVNVAAPVLIENKRLDNRPGSNGRYRLSLDIVPAGTRTNAQVAKALKERLGSLGVGLQPPVPRRAENLEERRARSFKPVVVIDPGHGGHDTGAMKFGVREKDVVLAFSLMLRDKLKETGRYRVLMTRSTDEFISLNGRREFADKHKAALFIAVHADYANSKASGATIYSLRDRVAKRLKSSAKREVARDVLGPNEKKALLASAAGVGIVKDILSDLAKREVEVTKHRTDLFTRKVIREMGQTTTMRRQPHRSAAFRVIKTAKMPSVLIELAYVSNRRDARRLTSKTWRDKVSTSIARAVDEYFSQSLSRVPM